MKTLLTLSVLATAVSAHAFGLSDIQFWVGSGANQAGFVVDFRASGAPKCFAWGFRWDGAATGEDMIRAIDAADPSLNAEVLGSAFGSYLNQLSYQGNTGPAWPTGYWSYWTGAVGNWTYASVGMSSRALANGTWDGWSYTRSGQSDLAPTTPVAAVPEPSSIMALALGGLLLRRVKR